MSEINSEELAKLIKEEMQKFLAENREVIVKRAEKRLRQQRGANDGQKKLS